jgi:uncharacterized membrane protein
MSQLLVMTFDGADEAHKVREALRDIEKAGRLSLDDFAIVTKDAEGKVHVKNVADKGMKWGAFGGAVLGPFLMFMFPIAGIALGAAAGAVVGKFFDMGVDKKFVKEVTESLKPNGSALFLLGRGDPNALTAALRPFQGTLVQTTVPPQIEQELKDALK